MMCKIQLSISSPQRVPWSFVFTNDFVILMNGQELWIKCAKIVVQGLRSMCAWIVVNVCKICVPCVQGLRSMCTKVNVCRDSGHCLQVMLSLCARLLVNVHKDCGPCVQRLWLMCPRIMVSMCKPSDSLSTVPVCIKWKHKPASICNPCNCHTHILSSACRFIHKILSVY